ncbi:hypothetical protein SEA_PCORAL7_51 [Gordonia phage PCoral7]|uniref:Uncharacterized protein n=1 Tax=Gordonia phage Toast TaxID=2599852 RepID=A0A5J6TB48_9CAUD|nr:hypothetical protein JZX81_gp51 [Gordonia phage Toast]QFG08111.1 hypothetical protein PBI_TOAST_51 [Gordonia phage Toast]UVF60559.1 hypothetical protein SEA_PCORAL7_51 [Gordonia phage PCoral7]
MSIAEIDQQRWAAEERRARRAELRGEPEPDEFEHEPIPEPRTPAQRTALRIASGRPAFEVATPPPSPNNRGIPQVRQELIAFCKAHPGQWVRYNAAGSEDLQVRTLVSYIDTGRGGFGLGFDTATRGSGTELYVVYTGNRGGDER